MQCLRAHAPRRIRVVLSNMKFFVLIFLGLCSCSHNSRPTEPFPEQEVWDCDTHPHHLIEEANPELSLDIFYWLSKNTVAYSYIGLNYTAEFAWDASVGLMHGLVLCAPFMLVSSFTAGDMVLNSYGRPPESRYHTPAVCFPAPSFSKSLFAPPLGRMAHTQTQKLRCPNTEKTGRVALVRASCYAQRKQVGDLEKAIRVLDVVMTQSDYACFSRSLQELLSAKYNKILSEYSGD